MGCASRTWGSEIEKREGIDEFLESRLRVLFATGELLSCSNHQNNLYLIVSVIHSGNSLTTHPFPSWIARSELIVV